MTDKYGDDLWENVRAASRAVSAMPEIGPSLAALSRQGDISNALAQVEASRSALAALGKQGDMVNVFARAEAAQSALTNLSTIQSNGDAISESLRRMVDQIVIPGERVHQHALAMQRQLEHLRSFAISDKVGESLRRLYATMDAHKKASEAMSRTEAVGRQMAAALDGISSLSRTADLVALGDTFSTLNRTWGLGLSDTFGDVFSQTAEMMMQRVSAFEAVKASFERQADFDARAEVWASQFTGDSLRVERLEALLAEAYAARAETIDVGESTEVTHVQKVALAARRLFLDNVIVIIIFVIQIALQLHSNGQASEQMEVLIAAVQQQGAMEEARDTDLAQAYRAFAQNLTDVAEALRELSAEDSDSPDLADDSGVKESMKEKYQDGALTRGCFRAEPCGFSKHQIRTQNGPQTPYFIGRAEMRNGAERYLNDFTFHLFYPLTGVISRA